MGLLTSLCSEVFTSSDWEILFDHVLSNQSFFLYFVVIAYYKYYASTIVLLNISRFKVCVNLANNGF